jgi:hypothetical protein
MTKSDNGMTVTTVTDMKGAVKETAILRAADNILTMEIRLTTATRRNRVLGAPKVNGPHQLPHTTLHPHIPGFNTQ